MATSKYRLLNDVKGVLRGLYIIHQSAAQQTSQTILTTQRHLTNDQRREFDEAESRKKILEEMDQMNQQAVEPTPKEYEQVHEETVYKEETKVTKDDQLTMMKSADLELKKQPKIEPNVIPGSTKLKEVVDQAISAKQSSKVISTDTYRQPVTEKQSVKIPQMEMPLRAEEPVIKRQDLHPGSTGHTHISPMTGEQKFTAEKDEMKAEAEKQEIPESRLGKSQQQQTEVQEDDDTPFFMRQDRPKFSTQQRYVPSGAASRAFQFGVLGVQLIGGTVSEAFKQSVGISKRQEETGSAHGIKRYAVNQANADRLSKTFRRMRGAVLKLGQILSTSEESIIPPVIKKAMESARAEADIMPTKQVIKVLDRELTKDWQKHFKEINLFPFAAASIGQVHEAILRNGRHVALKMQYQGVSDSIDSDLNNVKRLITLFGAPRGLYLNELIENTRSELYWETDYLREAKMQTSYRQRLLDYPSEYYAPEVISELTTKHILCGEFLDGVEIDTLLNQKQEVRDRAGTLLLKLCFKELFEWKIMQTDPNPANFLYNLERQRLNLLDFGAGREFDTEFLDGYMQVIHGAFTNDRDKIIHFSKKLKFLTGEENKEMLNAHYLGVLAVGDPFISTKGVYDFSSQRIFNQIYEVVPTMSKHRLSPPPKEIYSLHRKIIGTYLMCMKLKSQVPARDLFEETYENWLRTLKTPV